MSKQDTIISLLKEIDKNIDNVGSGDSNANLEELTITNNGEYTPQEGVDGFSKVVARVVPTKRAVIQNIRVTNDYIVDGYWAGELVDTSRMTSLLQAFYNCDSLQKIDVSNWDVSNITNMQQAFAYCEELLELDVSNWNINKVTTLRQTFKDCKKLKTLDVSNWDTSNVTTLSGAFQNCTNLTILDVSNWDTSNVTDFCGFGDCINLKTLDVSKWDTRKMIFFGFTNCKSLEVLDLSNWVTSNVTSLLQAFHACSALQILDVSNFDVSNVTNFQQTFNGCWKLKVLDLTNWDMNNATTARSLFDECRMLQSLIGNRTIDDVLENNIGALNGLKVALSLDGTILDRASLRAVINGLADLTGSDTQTLTLDTTLIAKLTEEDIAIATAKNWTLS